MDPDEIRGPNRPKNGQLSDCCHQSASNLLDLEKEERITAFVSTKEFQAD